MKIIILLALVLSALAVDWSGVLTVIQEGIDKGYYPGGVVGVATSKETLWTKNFGILHPRHDLYSPPVAIDAKFDLGRLSQMFTIIGPYMRLYDNGTIQTSDRLSRYYPAFFPNNKTEITIQNLLLHNSGLEEAPAVLPANQLNMTNYILNQKLQYPTGSKCVYSDEGMVILGLALLKVMNRNYTYEMFMLMTELGLRNISFAPSEAEKHSIPPTIFREKLLQGEVMNNISALYGGLAGNAGLFAPVTDVLRFMRLLLNRGQITGERRYFSESAVDKFTERVSGMKYNNTRALGFETVPNQSDRACGNKFSSNSYGIFGETGTMAWADRDKGIALVILTNSAYGSGRENCKAHFGKISDAVMTALGH